MPYHLAILHTALFWTVERGEGGNRETSSKILSCWTDYNKLATLIERKGKLSSLSSICLQQCYTYQSWRTLL